MTKKKAIISSIPTIKALTQQGIDQVPYQAAPIASQSAVADVNDILSYDTKGISYKGYYRKQISGNQWERIKQTTRFYILKIQNTATFDTSFPKNALTFWCTHIHVDYSQGTSPLTITLYDGQATNPKYRFVLDNSKGHFDIDLLGCPREFSATSIIIDTDATLGAAEWLNISLSGFEDSS